MKALISVSDKTGIVEFAKELEKAATAGDVDFINEHTPLFLDITWKLVEEIEALLFCLDAENPKPKKDKPDDDLLKKLLDACKDYDIDLADEAMAEIEKHQYESDDGLTAFLRDAIDRMDYKQIVEKLNN